MVRWDGAAPWPAEVPYQSEREKEAQLCVTNDINRGICLTNNDILLTTD